MSITTTHFPDLDALRFLAFFGVFCHHCLFWAGTLEGSWLYSVLAVLRDNGNLGIDFFFTLSSFLITYLALSEYRKTGRFGFKNFLVRRSLRIWPLYFLIIFIGFVGMPMVAGMVGADVSLPSLGYFMAFLANFYICDYGLNFLFLLTFLWSISVEEQFYIFWAFVLKFLKKYLVAVCFLLLGISILFRFFYTHSFCVYYHPVTYLPNFSMGALLAYSAFYETAFFKGLKAHVQRWHLGLFYFLVIGLFVFRQEVFSIPILEYFDNVVLALIFSFVIFEQTFLGKSLFKVRRVRGFSVLGKWSYGLYCYHGVVITLFLKVLERGILPESVFFKLLVYPAFILLVTVLVSGVSYRFFERFFLGFKGNFR